MRLGTKQLRLLVHQLGHLKNAGFAWDLHIGGLEYRLRLGGIIRASHRSRYGQKDAALQP
jgi:hypothetical protein